MPDTLLTRIASAPIIPVVTLEHPDDAVPLAEALLEGGIRAIEITLRSDAGLAAIQAVASAGLDIALGAGTITTTEALQHCRDAGASFFVSPGATPALLEAARDAQLSYLPGVVTPSEIVQALAYGHDFLKFFPAGSFGGAAMLRQYAGVFPQVQFCPTGGVSQANIADYLGLPNVCCVGGSWLSPADAIAARDWPKITQIAKDSVTAVA